MLIGIATLKSDPWKLEENFHRLEAMVREAAGRRAELVMAPESVLDGYVFNADPTSTKAEMLKIAQTVPDGEYLGRAGALCRELEIYLIFGFLEREGTDLFNACVLLGREGEVLAHHRKITTAGEYDITPGSELKPFDTPLGKVGFLLCSDRSADNVRTLAVQGGRSHLYPDGWQRRAGQHREDALARQGERLLDRDRQYLERGAHQSQRRAESQEI